MKQYQQIRLCLLNLILHGLNVVYLKSHWALCFPRFLGSLLSKLQLRGCLAEAFRYLNTGGILPGENPNIYNKNLRQQAQISLYIGLPRLLVIWNRLCVMLICLIALASSQSPSSLLSFMMPKAIKRSVCFITYEMDLLTADSVHLSQRAIYGSLSRMLRENERMTRQVTSKDSLQEF